VSHGLHTPPDRGFALLALLGVIGAASMAIVLAVAAMLPPLAGRGAVTTNNLETTLRAAKFAHRSSGAFPASLTATAAAAGLEAQGTWRYDPFGLAQDTGYGMSGSNLRVRSRGLDRAFGTADDITYLLPSERYVRLRQRSRLRLLRALFTVSPYRLAGTMSPTDQASMRSALRDFAIAQRLWLSADAATLPSLTARMATATATVAGLVALHSCPVLPPSLTGSGGLATNIGAVDSDFVDGAGRPLIPHATLGFAAIGNDLVGGSNDDM
jgi:hypothetical protein